MPKKYPFIVSGTFFNEIDAESVFAAKLQLEEELNRNWSESLKNIEIVEVKRKHEDQEA